MKKDKGFALISALIISIILSTIILAFVGQSKARLTSHKNLELKLQMQQKVDDALQKLIFDLTTGNKSMHFIKSRYYSQDIPLFGEAFDYDGCQVTVRDTASMLSIPIIDYQLAGFLVKKKFGLQAQVTVSESIKDWIDKDSFPTPNGSEISKSGKSARNFHLQSITELEQISAITPDIYKYLQKFTTETINPQFSFANMPEDLLQTVFDQKTAVQIHRLRKAKQLTYKVYKSLLKDSPQNLQKFLSSNLFDISITGRSNKVVYNKRILLDTLPQRGIFLIKVKQ